MQQVIAYLQQQGAEIVSLDIPLLSYGVMTYYIICPAEVSSNMSRLEGMRFGLQGKTHDFDSLYEYFSTIRSEGLGKEVQRRIMV
jgi:aspartyl-tRNA(Asn)/glutamyl-tRNA(Gln) amidotransferase subunit A